MSVPFRHQILIFVFYLYKSFAYPILFNMHKDGAYYSYSGLIIREYRNYLLSPPNFPV